MTRKKLGLLRRFGSGRRSPYPEAWQALAELVDIRASERLLFTGCLSMRNRPRDGQVDFSAGASKG